VSSSSSLLFRVTSSHNPSTPQRHRAKIGFGWRRFRVSVVSRVPRLFPTAPFSRFPFICLSVFFAFPVGKETKHKGRSPSTFSRTTSKSNFRQSWRIALSLAPKKPLQPNRLPGKPDRRRHSHSLALFCRDITLAKSAAASGKNRWHMTHSAFAISPKPNRKLDDLVSQTSLSPPRQSTPCHPLLTTFVTYFRICQNLTHLRESRFRTHTLA
jgi:hypothetical protein